MSKLDIFDSEIETEEPANIRVNRKFAEELERSGRKRELSRAKDLNIGLGDDDEDDDDEDEEDEDEDAELLSKNLELQILHTINSIRRKEPDVYKKDKTWFDEAESNDDSDEENEESHKKKTYKDIVREQLLEKGAETDAEVNFELQNSMKKRHENVSTKSKLSYNQEQEVLRRQFLESVGDIDDDVLELKESTNTRDDGDEEIEKALHEMKKLVDNKEDEEIDSFLTNYITKQKWKDGNKITIDKSDLNETDSPEDNVDDVDDIQDVEAAENFESKFNFRFEELMEATDGSLADIQVMGHARNVKGSLRRVDDKRKLQRQQQKENKEKERRQKEAEIRRLKNLKLQELQERLKRISEVGGLEDLGIDPSALDEEWDPEKHDAIMRQQFDDDYYDNVETYHDLETDPVNAWLLSDHEADDFEADEQIQDNSMTSDYSKKNEKTQSVQQLLKDNAANSHILDELYQLDYEDIVAGIPCRFKYKQVEKEDYGLTVDEILMADDTELNKLVSLKKLSAYSNFKPGYDDLKKITKRRRRLRAALRERQAEIDTSADIKESKKEIDEIPEVVQTKKRKRHKSKNADTEHHLQTQMPSLTPEIQERKVGIRRDKRPKRKNQSIDLSSKEKRLSLYQ